MNVHIPSDTTTNILIVLRFVHFVAGFIWLGLLYYLNLVHAPAVGELSEPVRLQVIPKLMSRVMWWFRWSSVVTVFAGVWYWSIIVGVEKRVATMQGFMPNAGLTNGSFFGIWTLASFLIIGLLMMGKLNDKPALIGVIVAVIVIAAAWLYVSLNQHGWESNRLISIGVGGGLGWIMMMNVWGIVWRVQKRLIQWTSAAATGQSMPPEAGKLSRLSFITARINFWLSFPMLFFMAAASHYPMFLR